MTASIAVTGVSKSFRRLPVLDSVSFEAGPGITGVLGPNGAGKTTLLRILATALTPDSGSVRLLGHDAATTEGRLAIRRGLGYLPQEPGHYRTFTAYDFVDYVAVLKEITSTSERRREVRRVLTAVGLEDQMHKRMGALSGGMRRRVALAQALLGDPGLLVLDEPTVGLDPVQRLRFREVISATARNRCVVLSTHLTEDIQAVCSRLVVVDRGRIRFEGEPSALAARAAGRVWVSDAPETRALLSWVTAEGLHRHIGEPPPGATLGAPTVEDGYLVLTGQVPGEGPIEEIEVLTWR
ncbi:ATP-binding cassette domain-containing protein [Cellulomonas sp. P5_C6]